MIKKLVGDTNNQVLEYIGCDYDKCLYLYLDYIKYGNNIDIYRQLDEENNLTAIILCYYTAVHIYSKNLDCNYYELSNLIEELSPSTINARKEIIAELYNLSNGYKVEYGWIKKLHNFNSCFNDCEIIKIPKANDFYEIAKLQISDEGMGSHYSFDILAKQIEERNKQGFSRNYFIKLDNNIVSHAATGGELNNLAIITSVITDSEFRRRGFAYKVVSNLCYDLINEGKEIYLVNYTKESDKLYEKIGFKNCCEWGKLFKKNCI